MPKSLVWLGLVLLVSACARSTEVVKIDPDLYMVRVHAAPARGDKSSAWNLALKEASNYCQKQGQAIAIIQKFPPGSTEPLGGRDALTFTCIAVDPMYKITATKAPETPFGVYIPKDFDDAFVELKRMLSPALIQKIQSGSEGDMIQYHFDLGLWMRNNWGLWKGSRLSRYFNDLGVFHPDDMSGIILVSFWRHLQGKSLDLDKQVAHYKEYWERMNREASPTAKPN